ncbi:MAG: hypothetical protein A2X55_05365 [Nitrospirae bacterium GWB2_47_37]|nr:MAG: hypothetical protein A2X55_05365 [Nitrospirae bacterium GWB2_47_37]
MEIINMIVQVKEGFHDTLLRVFEAMSHISVHGIMSNQIVLALDTDDIHVLARTTKKIQDMEGVLGIYPIFSKDALPL